ncbi:Lrp/AsnC family transcriptional regulator [Salmonella enterica subsp. enterica serovar Newport]
MKLDAWDKNILTLLQRDNRLSQREIAEQVNLSPSAVNRRIAALEEAGIIKGNVSLIDAGKVGRPVTIVVQVVIENERFNLLVLNVRDMAEYETLTRELFFSSGNIKSFKTIVVMQNAKQEMRVLIE